MKRNSLFLLIVAIFFCYQEIVAQPGCHDPFNPFYVCQSNFEHSDYLFYGEIASMERLEDGVFVNSSTVFYKMDVKINKSFKGKLSSSKITLYVGYLFTCHKLAVKEKYLFQVINGTIGNQKVYLAENISRPMTDYSPKAIKEVFSNINSALSNRKGNFVEGMIFQRFTHVRDISLKNEDADRIAQDLRVEQPLKDVLIDAISEKDGKIYQARSKNDGTFRIDNIPNGSYKVKLHLKSDEEQERPLIFWKNDSVCSRRWYIPVRQKNSN